MKTENMTLTGQGIAQPKEGHKEIFKAEDSDISVIKFEGYTVRIVNVYGEPWFIAKDICAALDIVNSRDALKSLDDDEKNTVALIYGNRGNPNHGVVAESGFYKLIARSRKASTPGTFAHRFSNWVFREVIPSIRKAGSYGVPFAFLNDHTRRKELYTKKASKRGKDLQSCKGEKSRLAAEEIELWRKYQPDLLEVH
ncbi:Bro-N domain-containing protein [Klebsiella oxytoca]|uniref:BRO-N domain-containing protein n=1 Tax=Klebsiella oxytoca TaxID=571 RepID=UPI002550D3B0|nr:BRO family protein [Klebsiella oxytoca]MDK6509591.1 BRO family protein [Klebsiella oxytoca]MDK8026517.1 BRO family protein [Klebsiella oxytoca]